MNEQIFYYLNSLAGKSVWFDSLVLFVGIYLGYWMVAGFLAIVIKEKNWKMFWFGTISVVLSRVVITELIRLFYFVPRPFVNNEVNQLIFHETSGSFPSGHATFFFALAMAVYFWHKKWGIVFFSGAILMSIARVIAGVHWPIDILGGAVVGILSAWIICKIFKNYYTKSQ